MGVLASISFVCSVYVEGNLCASKRPRHHQRELFSPERAAVRSDPLFHDHVRTCIAQRGRPPRCVLKEERLLRAGNKVRARNPTWHHVRRLVARARRGAEDRTVDIGMPEPKSERELSTRRGTEHRGAFRCQRWPNISLRLPATSVWLSAN